MQDILALTQLHQLSLGAQSVTPVHPALLASSLVKRTRVLGAAEAAVRELEDLVSSNVGHAQIVMALVGITTAEVVQLAPKIFLVPFEDVKPPKWLRTLADQEQWPLSRSMQPVAPSAALVSRVSFSPALSSETQPPSQFPANEVGELQGIANCLALASTHTVRILKVWFNDDDPRFPVSSGAVAFTDPKWGSGAVREPRTIEPQRVRKVVSDYLAFAGNRDPLDTGMSRLVEAQSGWRREDRAIDLGIALEAVLMYEDGRNSDANHEISFKLGIRAAWLLRTDVAARVRVCQQVRDLYGLRSQAAHSGRFRSNDLIKLEAQLASSITLVAEIIRALLSRGAWPDWNALVLGGDVCSALG